MPLTVDLRRAVRRLPDIHFIDYAAGATLWFLLLVPFYGAVSAYFREDIPPSAEGLERLEIVAFAFWSTLTANPLFYALALLFAMATAYRARIILAPFAGYLVIAGLFAWQQRVVRWSSLSISVEDWGWEIPFALTNFLLVVAFAFSTTMVALTPLETIGRFFRTTVRSMVSASLLGTGALIKSPRARFGAALAWGLLAALSSALLYYILLYGVAYRHFQTDLMEQLQRCVAMHPTVGQSSILEQMRDDGALGLCARAAAQKTMWTALALFAAAAALLPLAMRFFGVMRWRSLRQSLLAARSSDARRPILYLRPFTVDTDKVASGREHIAYTILAPTRPNNSIEGAMLESLSTIGPVVAIGNPTDRQPALGAAREYVDNDQWRGLVTNTLDAAQLAVIVVGNTPGIAWELQQAFEATRCDKLLVFPPSLEDEGARQIGTLLRQVSECSLEINREHVGFHFSSKGLATIFTCGTRNALTYEALARYFALRIA